MTHRCWCFTLNNYTEEERTSILNCECDYIVIGREVCPTTGTPHLQGYVEFKNSKRLTTMKNSISNRAYFAARNGTALQASTYCKKEGNFEERGIMSHQGARHDLLDVAQQAMNKDIAISDILDQYPKAGLLYGRKIIELRRSTYTDRTEPPIVVWLWGRTGAGKTRMVYDNHDDIYTKDGTQWWDGYEQQEAILIDDFDCKWPFRDLLRLLDRYQYQGQCKGGYVKINSPWIYITCEYPPEHRYWGTEYDQLSRRITFTFHLLSEKDKINVTDVAEVGGNIDPDFCA